MKSKHLVIIAVSALLVIAGIIVGSLVLLKNAQDNETITATEHDHDDHEHSHEADEAAGEAVVIDEMATTITFSGSSFSPQNISVKKGTVITIKNESQRTVQFSSGSHPDHNANPEMNLDALEPGESATYTATTIGTWQYHDHLDADIAGYITVREQ